MFWRAFHKPLGNSFILSCANVRVSPSEHELSVPTLGLHTTRGDEDFCSKLYCGQDILDSFPSVCGLEEMKFDHFQFWKLSWDPKSEIIKPVLNASTDKTKKKSQAACTR